MKKIMIMILVIVSITSTAFAGQYVNVGKVTSIKNDVIEVTDVNGHVWEFVEDGWNENETCIMIMSDEFTKDISDDVVVIHGHYQG